ncbi:MAG: hypothetical protein WC191_07150 [Proteiniphilum sp.]|nr:hypothetical protein [Proteiniphilum sp.]MDD2726133.1 hypothetical protein [Proteiniphilum sp.]MDD3331620.1 hypothetical protein [Proteiniphilum sp.]MDD3555594.1 hypothetical protein [Proteiniphilum sp.]MDD3978816.1 hypothetical protein [Proteiniphilum sp.]
MKFRKIVLVLSLLAMISVHASAQKHKGSFAIVVDSAVLANCSSSIDQYRSSVEADGLATHLIVDKWSLPDSIRIRLQQLYLHDQLEGAVFIGDIPVPMIRDAQHLTTAFKMDQRRAWDRSSIPSDRFYDDFDLKFEYLKQDSLQSLLHYYSLTSEGAQSVESEIYSARIKPPKYEGKSRFELIDAYLEKAVREKAVARRISQVTYFAGNGYNSNSMVARADERMALTGQFSALAKGKGRLNYIDHTFDEYVKGRLMAELEREDLDLAILHHHGADDTQYLNASPYTIMTDKWLEMARKFFRGKIRSAKDTTASKQYYIDNYNVPESWVNNAFDPEMMLQDSLSDAAMDIHIADLEGFTPGAPFVMLDACFNGSFHLDDYISGHYIFNPGHTVVVKANSVNTLQDIWTNQLIGLLELGVSVGNWAKEQFTLESHLMGDPTYRYASSRMEGEDLNQAIAHRRKDHGYWKRLLKNEHPEVKALAMKILFKKGALTPDQLLAVQTSDQSPTVRLMAYHLLLQSDSEQMVPSIQAGLHDNYELIRRFAGMHAGENQSPRLLDDLVKIRLSPGVSERVYFQVRGAVEQYAKEDALAAFDRQLEGRSGIWYEKIKAERANFERILSAKEKDMMKLLDPEVESRNKRFNITALRNSNQVAYLDTLFRFMKESDDQNLRQLLAEAFGWYTRSWKKQEIVDFCRAQAAVEKDDAVKKELLRTVRRLTD